MLRYRATYGSELQMDGIVTVFPSIAFICHPLNGCDPVVSGTFGRSRHPNTIQRHGARMGAGAGAWGSPSRPRTPWRPPATFGLRGFARAGIFIQTGACGLWLCTAAWSEPRRSLALKTAAAWGEHLFSTHWLTRVGVHPAFRLSRTPNVRAQVSCGGTFSSLAAYRERNSRVAG